MVAKGNWLTVESFSKHLILGGDVGNMSRDDAVQVALQLGEATAVGIACCVCGVVWVESVRAFPIVGQAVVIGVRRRRAGAEFRPAADIRLRINDAGQLASTAD